MRKQIGIISILLPVIVVLIFLVSACSCQGRKEKPFSIAFMTDIHLEPERDAVRGFEKALDTVNILKPDFILTGGDLVMDAMGQTYGRADSLYNLYNEVIRKATVPVYNTMGNHDIWGIYSKSGSDHSNPEFGEAMFAKRIGESYYSFMHKGWKFIILNSIEDTGMDRYVGEIDTAQIFWLKQELVKTDPSTPIVVSTHIPFISAMRQVRRGSTVPNDSSLVVFNSKKVTDLFKNHNLKLVLQGHLHILEDIYIDGVHYITGGAVSGGWWRGPNLWTQEGFLWITFGKDDFTWKYIDYNWVTEAEKEPNR